MAEIRVFGLRLESGKLKIQKYELIQASPNLSRRQATRVQFSPDTKWLATIGTDNSVYLYRRSEMDKDKTSPLFLQTSVELKRLRRDTSNTKARDAGLGNYNRAINRLAFSADSRILAVSDIAGFLDTWVIEGQEDLGQGSDQRSNPANGTGDFDSSDEEDSEEGDNHTTMFGEHWIRNPTASLLAKLPATPLVFIFRPSTTPKTGALTNGHVGVHPTRHNPHPRSHDLPNGEDRLFILTAENQIYEFNVLSGTLSDWSRRNPTSSLPQEFRNLKDRAKGAIWDLRDRNERIWLYGVSWLWMFDLSRDLPNVNDGQEALHVTNGFSNVASLKRKRRDNDEDTSTSRSRIDTGAGSKIPSTELGIGIGRRMCKFDGGERTARRWISLDAEQDLSSDEEDGYALASESDLALIKLRRGDTKANGRLPNRRIDNSTDADSTENDDTHNAKAGDGKRPPYWHTYKYRPILGIVPLRNHTVGEAAKREADDGSQLGLEVALVERPLSDVDLPPRYFGHQEWDS